MGEMFDRIQESMTVHDWNRGVWKQNHFCRVRRLFYSPPDMSDNLELATMGKWYGVSLQLASDCLHCGKQDYFVGSITLSMPLEPKGLSE